MQAASKGTTEGQMRDRLNNIQRYDYKGHVLIVRKDTVNVHAVADKSSNPSICKTTSLDIAMKFVDGLVKL